MPCVADPLRLASENTGRDADLDKIGFGESPRAHGHFASVLVLRIPGSPPTNPSCIPMDSGTFTHGHPCSLCLICEIPAFWLVAVA